MLTMNPLNTSTKAGVFSARFEYQYFELGQSTEHKLNIINK